MLVFIVDVYDDNCRYLFEQMLKIFLFVFFGGGGGVMWKEVFFFIVMINIYY